MKGWVVRVALLVLLVIVVLIGAAFWSDSDTTSATRFVSNEQARTIRADWQGTPVDQRGRFVNDEFPFLPKTIDLLKWQIGSNQFAAEKEADDFRLNVLDPTDFLAGSDDCILWLGHASFYIRLNGKAILIDPVFGTPPFISRYTEVPSPLEKIKTLHYVLLTHDHRDHTDEATIRAIAQRFPEAKFLAGFGTKGLLKDWTTPTNSVEATGWFQEFILNDAGLKVYFLPVRHWSRRGLFDTNQRLWGGYVIESGETTIYHGGDSGYGRHYKETGELFPNIDYFLIGIGAYEPRWFMKPNHNNPADVIRAFNDIGAKTLVPMHFGTFNLSDEPPGAPIRELTDLAEKANISNKVRTLSIYEHIAIGKLPGRG